MTWKVVGVRWTNYVNELTMECKCGTRFQWWSRISVAACPKCGGMAYWHDWNGSEDQPLPIAAIQLDETEG